MTTRTKGGWKGIGSLGLALVAVGTLHAAVHTWKGGTGLWDDDSKWTHGVPVEGGDVVIATGTVFLTNVTPRLNSLNMSGGTLFFSNNWDACLIAFDIWIRGGRRSGTKPTMRPRRIEAR